eukprot:gene7676-9444_t
MVNPIPPSEAWGTYGQAKTVVYANLLGVGIGICVFHMWEYIWMAMYHPHKVSTTSFLLNHSTQFNLALTMGFLEYWIESHYFPYIKSFNRVMLAGTALMVFGQLVRSLAMNTAGQNFTHLVQDTKRKEHVLVTTGIYSVIRHPSYFGWFIWSVATQIVLLNPICFVAYIYASYSFFSDRIEVEEEYLIDFFGNDYKQYRKKVWSGIPFIK